jgi:type II secretory pathway component PulF
MNSDTNSQLGDLIPAILGLITLVTIIIGVFGVVVNFEAVYNSTATNYTVVTDGLLTNSTTHQQVATTSGVFATIMPNMVWILLLIIVIVIIYAIYQMTKRRRGRLITRRKRL